MNTEENTQKPIDQNDFDASVNPADDFYQYVNGAWLQEVEIPASESRWGSFIELHEENQKKLHAILEELAEKENLEKGSNEQKLRDFYRSGMNEQKIEEEGARGIKDELGMITNLEQKEDLAEVFAHLHASGASAGFSPIVDHDDKHAEEMTFRLHQGGLGLPDRDYYFGEENEALHEKYTAHISRMLQLLEISKEESEKSAEQIFELEKKIAENSKTRTELRDPEANYHKMTRAELRALAPHFDWEQYFEKIEAPSFETLIVTYPDGEKAFSEILEETPLETWKAYLKFHFLDSVASKLSSDFVNESFDFSRNFSGATELKPRWKRVLSEVNALLGEALGKEYVERHFRAESKTRIEKMVEDLRESFRERLKNLDWMTAETKERAFVKLDIFEAKIGYPDEWRDYTDLEISDDSYVKNHLRAVRFEFARDIAKIGKPVDYGEWLMPPATVNAYFTPNKNQVVFPAGILQPPFFYADADDAVNYGAIGSVIGHEMTHGFDDAGRQFDETGSLNDWWSEADAEHFERRAKVLEEQFNQYAPLEGHFVNGKLTLGENIADLGGVVISYHALQKHFEENTRPDAIDGFTPEQRFFLGNAQVWRMKNREELIKMLLVTDPHSPNQFRSNGPASNLEEFYEAFDVQKENALYRVPEDRAKIW